MGDKVIWWLAFLGTIAWLCYWLAIAVLLWRLDVGVPTLILTTACFAVFPVALWRWKSKGTKL